MRVFALVFACSWTCAHECIARYSRVFVKFPVNDTIYRLQHDGLLREQSVPPPLPAYNKYMCAVDVTGQIRKTYGFDRKSRRSWIRLFYTCKDFSINNAHILYKHNCKKSLIKPKDQHAFRLELAHLLLQEGTRAKTTRPKERRGATEDTTVCHLMKVSEIGLKRGKCHQCLKKKRLVALNARSDFARRPVLPSTINSFNNSIIIMTQPYVCIIMYAIIIINNTDSTR